MNWSLGTARELAAELMQPLGERLSHVAGVADRTRSVTTDPACLMAAWLHDIGYVEHLQQTGMHAIDGAIYLERVGAPRQVVSLVAFHTGAEFEAEERGLLERLLVFAPPPVAALDALTLADLTTGPSGELVTVDQRLAEILTRYEPRHPVHRAVIRSRPALETSCQRAAQRGLTDVRLSPSEGVR